MDTPTSKSAGIPVTRHYWWSLGPEFGTFVAMALAAIVAVPFVIWLTSQKPDVQASPPFVTVSDCPNATLEACASSGTRSPSSATTDYVETRGEATLYEPTRHYRELGVRYVSTYGQCVVGYYDDGTVQVSLNNPSAGFEQVLGTNDPSPGSTAADAMVGGLRALLGDQTIRSACAE